MSNSPHTVPQHDARDLNPRTNGPSARSEYRSRRAQVAASALGSLGAGEVQSWEYVEPFGEFLHKVRSPLNPSKVTVVPSLAGGVTFAPGAKVTVLATRSGVAIAGLPPSGDRGVSQTEPSAVSQSFSSFQIESISPSSFTGGTTTAATVTGTGFVEVPLDTLEALVYEPNDALADAGGWITDPHVTFANQTWVSATSFTVDIIVSLLLTSERGLTLRMARG